MEVNHQGNWTWWWVMYSEYLDDIVPIPIIPDDYAIENNLKEDLPGIYLNFIINLELHSSVCQDGEQPRCTNVTNEMHLAN